MHHDVMGSQSSFLLIMPCHQQPCVLCSEEVLHAMFSVYAPLLDLRYIKEKYTGAPRGIAFAEFHSIADAGKVMLACQGAVPEGQVQPLRLCYAIRDKGTVLAGATEGAFAAGSEAAQAAAAMQQYNTWQPKEFDESVLASGDNNAGTDAAAADARAGGSHAENIDQKAARDSASGQTSTTDAMQSGFVYDSNMGYYYDSVSGYYYDANTRLYYHPSANQWYMYDQATAQYTACGTGEQQQKQQHQADVASSQQQDTAAGQSAANQHYARGGATTAGTTSAAVEPRSATTAHTGTAAQAKPRRGAVIGAAAKYNPQGVMLAVALAQVRKMG